MALALKIDRNSKILPAPLMFLSLEITEETFNKFCASQPLICADFYHFFSILFHSRNRFFFGKMGKWEP
jgi:hypothetical protein